MFSSFFTTVDPTAQNIHPITSCTKPSDLCGELTVDDLDWCQSGGFMTETQTWYQIIEGGSFLMCQVIYSSVGLWYPNVQFTCRLVTAEGEKVWRSQNVTNFVCPVPGTTDKTSSKGDQYTIKFSTERDSCSITANVCEDLQITLDVKRVTPGFKVGNGPKGGFSYFGTNLDSPDGYVVHRFWPRTTTSGHVIYKGKAMSATGDGMFVNAIQGMRPNLLASRWNFLLFQSKELGGVTAMSMEFVTTEAHGKHGAGSGFVAINVGYIVVGGMLVAVTGETTWPGEPAENDAIKSQVIHCDLEIDPETEYNVPSRIDYVWAGPSLVPGTPGTIGANFNYDVGTVAEPKGLVEKVDVLAQIPKVLKAVVNYVAGTKPFIYTYFNPASLKLTAPAGVLPEGESATLSGVAFAEAAFVS